MTGFVSHVMREALMVSGFVMVMMLLIEYVNVVSQGRWNQSLKTSSLKQLLLATFLGMTPGCLGAFLVVSMFTHGTVRFGALVACMVATMGDETFVLISMAPSESVTIMLLLGAAGMTAGWLTNLIWPSVRAPFGTYHWPIHQEDHHGHESVLGSAPENLRHPSWQRLLLSGGILVFTISVLAGWLGHEEGGHTEGSVHMEEYITWLFSVAALAALILALWVKEHFLLHHWWQHIIRGHFPKIFLWTFGVILVLSLAQQLTDFSLWVQSNPLQVLGLAILIGLIPQSGPHILFVTLFAHGEVPLSILLANSIVQEGHAGLPLLAESRSSFFRMKAISAIIGIFVGLLGYFLEF